MLNNLLKNQALIRFIGVNKAHIKGFDLYWIVMAVLILIIALVIIRTAWVSDDAFITFRVIENFWQGNGLRWNISERVWVYTHPLWLFLLSLFYPFNQNLYLVSIIFGGALTLLTVWLVLRQTKDIFSMLLIAGCMAGSAAFIDFSTSGLENSLGYFLVALFILHIGVDSKRGRDWFFLGLLAGFGVLTRPDLGAFFFPALLIILAAERPTRTAWLRVLMGFFPLFLWEIFAIIYYGVLVPNTALAKLNHGIKTIELLPHGFAYLLDTLTHDTVTITVLISGIVFGFISRRIHFIAISISLLVFVGYIVMIGGDYMRGRFFAIPFVAALFIIALTLEKISRRVVFSASIIFWCYAFLAATPLTSGANFTSSEINSYGLANERGFYFQTNGFINQNSLTWQDHIWAIATRSLTENQMVARCQIGMFGYAAPKSAYIIDPLGLSEPFLARLPAKRPFRIGHFERNFPRGYLESKISGENRFDSIILREIYDDTLLLSRGSLWSRERLASIIRLNLGTQSTRITLADYDPNLTGEGVVKNPQRHFLTCMGMPGELQPELRLIRKQ